MRISDWSSDVCASDLAGEVDVVGRAETTGPVEAQRGLRVELERQALGIAIEDAGQTAYPGRVALRGEAQAFDARVRGQRAAADAGNGDIVQDRVRPGVRSEEHTSELQSLMRISYAVFCLQKKKQKA